ncbi:hypothetical protein V6Z12_D11G196000 [Gossypium hirsutum]
MGCRICPPRYKSSLKTPKLTCSLFYVLDDGTTVDLSFSADFSFRITVRASPSTHTSLKPSSFLKHALASAVVGSGMFFHWYVHEAMTKPSLFRTMTLEYDV